MSFCSQMFLKSSLQAVAILRTIMEQTKIDPARPAWTPTEGDIEMQDLKDTFARNAATLPADFAALAALVVILFTGLSLPALF